ncbi:hypothetical protein Ddc_15231 [Ditylenchus destructor]|nr:hypothetical protein Ddc_15231 [Ditylenchus destructor]
MSSNHSSKTGADLHSGWEDGNLCSCEHGYYYVTSIHISEVDMMGKFERAFFEAVRLGAKGVQRIGNSFELVANMATADFDLISGIKKWFRRQPFTQRQTTIPYCEDEPVYVGNMAERTLLPHTRWEVNPFQINRVTHDALEVQYKCALCCELVYYTYEISLDGPTETLGYYIRERRRKHEFCPNEKTLTYSDIKHEFKEMPAKYKLFKNNCKIWSGKLHRRILNRIQEKEHEKKMRENETYHKTKPRRFEMATEACPMPYKDNYFRHFNSSELCMRHDLLFHS